MVLRLTNLSGSALRPKKGINLIIIIYKKNCSKHVLDCIGSKWQFEWVGEVLLNVYVCSTV